MSVDRISGLCFVILLFAGLAHGSPALLIHLGDSLTEGVGDTEYVAGYPLAYPGRLQEFLHGIEADLVVHNLGISGWTSAELIDGTSYDDTPGQLPRAEQLIAQPENQGRRVLAFVWIGSNDLFGTYGWKCDSGSPPGCAEADLAEYRANMDTILQRLQGAGALVYVGLMDDVSRRPCVADPAYGDCLSDITPDELALLSAQAGRYNQAIRELAPLYGATVVDFSATTLFEDDATLVEDGLHPNGAGYDAIASLWRRAVEPDLACRATTYDDATGMAHLPNIHVDGSGFEVYLAEPFHLAAISEGFAGCRAIYHPLSGQATIPNLLLDGRYLQVTLNPPFDIAGLIAH